MHRFWYFGLHYGNCFCPQILLCQRSETISCLRIDQHEGAFEKIPASNVSSRVRDWVGERSSTKLCDMSWGFRTGQESTIFSFQHGAKIQNGANVLFALETANQWIICPIDNMWTFDSLQMFSFLAEKG